MKKSDKKYIFILISIILIICRVYIKDIYINFISLFNSNNNIEYTNEYINTLEDKISKYEEIDKLNDCIKATITYRNPIFWYDTFTIDKGINDGVKLNDMVINNTGFIGIIDNVYPNTSEVLLITSISNNKHITVGLTNDINTIYGIIDMYDRKTNKIIISELTNYIEGDIKVITTNFTNEFIEGIIIGKVDKIIESKNELSYTAIVTPTMDLNDIKYVCVK